MSKLRKVLEFGTSQLGVHRPSKKLFDRLVRPQVYAYRLRQKEFFATLIRPGALVFDVGAHWGDLSAVFLEVGARVVTVEPNPKLASVIQRRYGRELVVEPVAVGDRAGQLPLHLSARDALSTLSEEWMRRANRPWWNEAVTVPVVTLDDLVGRHGVPQFVKLDVEGFELKALRGLSAARVQGISFEYHAIAIDEGLACIERAVELGFRRFNETPGDTPSFLGPWLSSDKISDRLSRASSDSPDVYGDIYAMK